MEDSHRAEQLEIKTLARGNWMKLLQIRYKNALGQQGIWESAERLGRRSAVVILAKLMPSDKIIFVRQYRAPLDMYTIEFPAGLVDDGETPEQTAKRELLEETGYRADNITVLPSFPSSAGMSSEEAYLVIAEIDENKPANQSPTPNPDEGELIEIFEVKTTEVVNFLQERMKQDDKVDMRVAAKFLLDWEN